MTSLSHEYQPHYDDKEAPVAIDRNRGVDIFCDLDEYLDNLSLVEMDGLSKEAYIKEYMTI